MTEDQANSPSGSPANVCARCGSCCQKGGPAFHQEDQMLVKSGKIPSRYLFTIREGEYAYDNVRQCLMPADSDIIKIKGKDDTWTCIFFNEQNKACEIYSDRPLECRALKCWDTRELEKMYVRRRLTREDLISEVEGLWDLIKDHQKRCNYAKIQNLIEDLEGRHKTKARRKLTEIIKYDIEIRKLVVTQGGMDPQMLDFLFGRPLTKTLPNYGIKVRRHGENISLAVARNKVRRQMKEGGKLRG